MRITLIAAISEDGFISEGQGIPWSLPLDHRHFRRCTADQWLLLGRRTFEEMTGWFQGHTPLVLSHRPLPAPWQKNQIHSVTEAVDRCVAAGVDNLWVIGGSSVYAAAMPLATHLSLTHVATRLGSGIPFPAISDGEWQVTSRQHYPLARDHSHAFDIIEYQRGL
jgi:dihydrofolate reductase